MVFRRIFFLLTLSLYFLCSTKDLGAQFMPSTLYQGQIVSFYSMIDTTYQYYDRILDSIGEDKFLRKTLPFKTNQYFGCADKIEIIPNQETFLSNVHYSGNVHFFNMSNYFFEMRNRFRIGNDTSDYFYYLNPKQVPSTDSEVAFVIMPGSGPSQSVHIADYNTNNYHNIPCVIAKKCAEFGDVYTYVKPNNDFTQYWAFVSPTSRFSSNDMNLRNKTNIIGQNFHANAMIQMCALVKDLKSRYKKVIVMGLSAGGWASLFTSLQTEPDACLSASGYSILFNALAWTQDPAQLYFDGLFTNYPIDSVRRAITASSTHYMFSYAKNDGIVTLDQEFAQKNTENYIDSIPLSNTAYYYGHVGHTYPCDTLNSYFTRIIKMPKAELKPISTCNSDSATFKIEFCGDAPFTGQLYCNDTLIQSITSASNMLQITTTKFGKFELRNLLDTNNIVGFRVKPIVINKNPKLVSSVSFFDSVGICKGLTVPVQVNSNRFPVTVEIKNLTTNAIATNTVTAVPSNILNMNRGQYEVVLIKDSLNCQQVLNTPISLNLDTLSINTLQTLYNCDSNRNLMTLLPKGDGPYKLNYFQNGISATEIITGNTNKWWNNGIYYFTELEDKNKCKHPIDKFLDLSNTKLLVGNSTVSYNCDSSKYYFAVNVQGKSPLILHFIYDGNMATATLNNGFNQLPLDDGNYTFVNITDANNCSVAINSNFQLANQPYSYLVSNVNYDCPAKSAFIHHSINGNGPFSLALDNNLGNKDTLAVANNLWMQFLDKGNYYLGAIIDNNGCIHPIQQSINATYDTLSGTLSKGVYNCALNKTMLSIKLTGNPPFTLTYTKNGLTNQVATSDTNFVFAADNGIYNFLYVEDATGCQANFTGLNNQHLNYLPIGASANTPFFDCALQQHRVDVLALGNAPYQLTYLQDGIVKQKYSSSSTINLHLENGNYTLLNITDTTGCAAPLNVVHNLFKDSISAAVSSKTFDCISQQFFVEFSLTGKAPYLISYKYNGIDTSILSTTNALTFNLVNGTYNFLKIKDADNCEIAFSQNVLQTVNYIPLSLATTNVQFDCIAKKSYVLHSLQGSSSPYKIYYTYNGLLDSIAGVGNFHKQFLNDGNYAILSVSDAVGCSKMAQKNLLVKNDTLTLIDFSHSYNCNLESEVIQINLAGKAPYLMSYTVDGNPISLTVNTNSFSQGINNGNYQFLNIQDNNGCTIPISQNVVVANDSLKIASTSLQFDCNLKQSFVTHSLEGNAPYMIRYTHFGILDSVSSATGTLTQYFDEGPYNFVNVSDSKGCTISTQNTYFVTNDTLALNSLSHQYNCAIESEVINLQLDGKAPYQLNYLKNGVAQVSTMIANTFSQNLNNGNYQFLNIQDNNGCVIPINQNILVANDSLKIATTSLQFDCNLKRSFVTHSLAGNAPYTIRYTHFGVLDSVLSTANTLTQYFDEGPYSFVNVSDNKGCNVSMQSTYFVTNDTLELNSLTNQYNCGIESEVITLQLNGKAPYQLHYLKNGLPQLSTFAGNNFSQNLGNGNYQFLNIQDGNGCSIPLGQTLNISNTVLSATLSTPVYNNDSNKTKVSFYMNGNAPYTINYFESNISKSFTSLTDTFTTYLSNGNYLIASVTDSKGCTILLNQFYLFNYTQMFANITEKKFDCDSSKYRVKVELQGNLPFTVNTLNLATGVSTSHLTYNNLMYLYFDIGNYVVTNVTDNIGSFKILNDTITTSHQKIQAGYISEYYDCPATKYLASFETKGSKPLKITYLSNSAVLSFLTNTDTTLIDIPFGISQLLSVEDTIGCTVTTNYIVQNTHKALSYAIGPKKYDCDSQKVATRIYLQGDYPFKLFFRKVASGATYSKVVFADSIDCYFEYGQTILDSIVDASCVIYPNASFANTILPITSTISAPSIVCDSGKYAINVQIANSVGPFNLLYNFNGSASNKIFTSGNTMWVLNDGNYFLDKIQDSLGCIFDVKKPIMVNYQPLQVNSAALSYECSEPRTNVTLNPNMQVPFILNYKKDGGTTLSMSLSSPYTFKVDNGTYDWISVVDTLGCIIASNLQSVVKHDTLAVQYGEAVLNCPERVFDNDIVATGDGPFTVTFLNNNQINQLSSPSIFNMKLSSGAYNFLNIADVHNCKIDLNKLVLIPEFTKFDSVKIANSAIEIINLTDVANSTLKYDWLLDGAKIHATTKNGKISFNGNGEYQLMLTDSLGCSYFSNIININYPSNINIFPNPTKDDLNIVIANKDVVNVEYAIIDQMGNTQIKATVQERTFRVSLRALAQGNYVLKMRISKLSGEVDEVTQKIIKLGN